MEKRLTNRDKQALATKQKIYQTGIQLFKEQGYEHIDVNEITKAADVSVGTFYRYYASKMDLYMEIFIHAEDYFKEFETLDLSKEEPYQLIQHFFQVYVQLNENGGIGFLGDILAVSNRDFLQGKQEFEQDVVHIIEFYQTAGNMANTESAQSISDTLFLAARGTLLDWCLKKGTYNLSEMMTKIIGKILDSYIIQ